jgi:uncharacterized tellurite resistance protein B-like protein
MYLGELNQVQREALLCLAHDVIVSDGDLRPGEIDIMRELRREMRIQAGFAAQYMPVSDAESLFASRRHRITVLLALIRVAYADSSYEIEEQCFLQDLRRAFAISDEDFLSCETWVKRLISLNQEAELLFAEPATSSLSHY